MLKKKNIFGKIINIGYGKGTTIKNLIVNIQKVTKGGEPQYGLFKLRNHENPVLVPSISLAKKILHWQPNINLTNGLRKTKHSIIKMGRDKVYIISNESIFEDATNSFCDNLDMKSIPEGLSKYFDVNIIARKSKLKRSFFE